MLGVATKGVFVCLISKAYAKNRIKACASAKKMVKNNLKNAII